MSDEACSECDRNCPCRYNSYNCWVREANSIKEAISLEQISKIKDTMDMLQAINESLDSDDITSTIYHMKNVIELYDEPETEVG